MVLVPHSPVCLTQIPKLSCKIERFHAAFSIGGLNFGEASGGQCKRLLNKGLSTGVTTPVFGHVQDQMMSTSAKDCPAGENLETQRSRLFVSLKRRINRTLKFAQEIESKEHSQESRLGSKERAQTEVVSRQFVFEFVNAALHARSAVVIL
jgi:hypothetical protein